MESRIVLGLAQFDVVKGRSKLNLEKGKRYIEEASARGADILLLPELWYSGYDLQNAAGYACDLLSELGALAASRDIFLYGSLITRRKGGFYNTAYLIDSSGHIAGEYDKIHLFGGMNEEEYLLPGECGVISDTPFGSIGLSICYDLRFPELFRLYSLSGAYMVLLCAQWPAARADHWDILVRARAIENQLFIAAVNRVGGEDDTLFGGRSMVVDPRGRVAAWGGDAEELIMAEIDLDMVDRVRKEIPALEDAKGRRYSLAGDIESG